MFGNSFTVDKKMKDTLKELKTMFGVETEAEVIEKSLKLAKFVKQYADVNSNAVTISAGVEAQNSQKLPTTLQLDQ